MKAKDFKVFETDKSGIQTDITTKAAEFVSSIFDFKGNNKIAEYANEHDLDYRDFATAVIAEVKRELNG